jgi:hypothetical protein
MVASRWLYYEAQIHERQVCAIFRYSVQLYKHKLNSCGPLQELATCCCEHVNEQQEITRLVEEY